MGTNECSAYDQGPNNGVEHILLSLSLVAPAYRKMVLQSLPQVCVLDGVDRLGNEAPLGEDSPGDTPGLEDYADFLFSSETSGSEQVW